MAIVEVWQRRELPQGQLQAPRGVSVGEAIGVGLQDLGQAGGQAVSDIVRATEIAEAKQEKRDQAAALNASLEFGNAFDARFEDLKKGAAPGAEGFADAVLEDFDKQSQAFMATVPESARDFAQAQVLRMRGQAQTTALSWQTETAVAHDKNTMAGILSKAAASVMTDPSRVDTVQASITEMIKGWKRSPEREATMLAEAGETLSTAALGGLVAKNPRAALAEIDTNASAWSAVGADKLLVLRNQAEAKIRQEEALARMEANLARAAAEGDLLGRLDLVLPGLAETGVIPTDANGQPLVSGPEEILALIPGRRGEALARKFVVSQMEGQDRQTMLSTNLADDVAQWQAMAPKPGQPWSVEEQGRYEAFGRALGAKMKALEEDPASLVSGSSTVQQAWSTAQSLAATPGADPKMVQKATAAAVNTSLEAQASLGAAPWQAKPLPKAEAKALAAQMRAPGLSPAAFQNLAQQVVALGPQAVGQVIGEGAPPAFAALAAVDDPIAQELYAAAVTLKPSDVDNILRSTGVTRDTVADAVRTELAPLFGTMSAEARGLYQEGATAAAIYALGRGAEDETAAAKAVTKSLIGGVHIDGRLRVPAALDLDHVKIGLARSMDDLLSGKAGIEVVPPPGFGGLDALRTAAQEGGLTWVTDETGNAAVLATPDGRWIQVIQRTSRDRATKGRFTVTFDDAARIGMQPDAEPEEPTSTVPTGGGFAPGVPGITR